MATQAPPTPTREALPGQHEEVPDGWHEAPMTEYLSWPLVSSSLIGAWRARTPKFIRWLLDERADEEPTASKSLGSLAHTAVLEPDLLEVEYVVEPDPDPEVFRTGSGKPASNVRATGAWKEMIAELEATGRKVVSREAWANALEMRDAVHSHPRASALIRAEGFVERSAVVTDRDTGVRLKIRPDKLVPAVGANVNVKTSQNALEDVFIHDFYKFGYFRDFAFYERALRQAGFEHRRAIALVLDTKGPKDDRVALYEIDAGAMDAGHQLVEKYLYEIAECFDRDTWPGHPEDIRSISLPHYAWTRVDEEIAA